MGCYPAETDWSCSTLTETEVEGLSAEMRSIAEEWGWSTLASLSGHRLALCPTVLRPVAEGRCRPEDARDTAIVTLGGSAGGFHPYMVGGRMRNAPVFRMRNAYVLTLPGPISEIVEIVIGGVVLPEGAYELVEGLVYRQDGEAWPDGQELTDPLGAPGTWTVSYYRGVKPGRLESIAAGILAGEFVQACQDGDCRLPANATTVNRAGVSVSLDPEMLFKGIIGIDEVDSVTQRLNPNRLRRAPVVFSGRRG